MDKTTKKREQLNTHFSWSLIEVNIYAYTYTLSSRYRKNQSQQPGKDREPLS